MEPDVVGYKLYFGLESYSYTTSVDVGMVTQATVSLPMAGSVYFFAATTYDQDGNESDFSEENTVSAGPGGTTVGGALDSLTQAGMQNGSFGFSVNGQAGAQYVVEASTNLVNWVRMATNTVPFAFTDPDSAKYPQRFYRSRPLSEIIAATAALDSLTQAGMAGGLFSFTVNGETGTQYVVEASTNLVNWVRMATNAAPFIYTDPDSPKYPQRFYRSIPLSEISGSAPALDSLTQEGMAGDLFSFTVTGVTGAQYVVEASTNLINWVGVATNTAPFTFTDPDFAQYPQRFYRSRPM